MKDTVVILCGGGPAPGINTVISSVIKIFLKNGYRILGLHGGYKCLFTDEENYEELDYDFADRIFSQGGSAIKMSRFKPKDTPLKEKFFTDNNVKLLVTIGGDDTASTANRITQKLAEQNINISNIHVPKTIDNDLPLPPGVPTFGFHSAKDEGVKIGTTVYEDARTSENWFVLSCMGREAGHLAFGIGSACHYPMIIIPEMFDKTRISVDKISKLMISAMLKRKLMNIQYGATIISEGVFHFMDDKEIEKTGVNFTYDDHGHPELSLVSKSHIFNMYLQHQIKALGLVIKSRPVEMGFELRCCRPIGYDLTFCTLLGNGVYKLFKEGFSGCMVSIDHFGNPEPIFLKDVEDEHGKVKPRVVNMNSGKIQTIFHNNLDFITEDDYESAKAYVEHPEEFDFYKILNWERPQQ